MPVGVLEKIVPLAFHYLAMYWHLQKVSPLAFEQVYKEQRQNKFSPLLPPTGIAGESCF